MNGLCMAYSDASAEPLLDKVRRAIQSYRFRYETEPTTLYIADEYKEDRAMLQTTLGITVHSAWYFNRNVFALGEIPKERKD